jgi:hypothetical protein
MWRRLQLRVERREYPDPRRDSWSYDSIGWSWHLPPHNVCLGAAVSGFPVFGVPLGSISKT